MNKTNGIDNQGCVHCGYLEPPGTDDGRRGCSRLLLMMRTLIAPCGTALGRDLSCLAEPVNVYDPRSPMRHTLAMHDALEAAAQNRQLECRELASVIEELARMLRRTCGIEG